MIPAFFTGMWFAIGLYSAYFLIFEVIIDKIEWRPLQFVGITIVMFAPVWALILMAATALIAEAIAMRRINAVA